MNRKEMEERVLMFGVNSLDFLQTLGETAVTRVAIYQLAKASTSVGANYCDAGRAQSRADFDHKIAICTKEAAESNYWYKIIHRMRWGQPDRCVDLLQESEQLLAILVTTGRTSKTRQPPSTRGISRPTSNIPHSPSAIS